MKIQIHYREPGALYRIHSVLMNDRHINKIVINIRFCNTPCSKMIDGVLRGYCFANESECVIITYCITKEKL